MTAGQTYGGVIKKRRVKLRGDKRMEDVEPSAVSRITGHQIWRMKER